MRTLPERIMMIFNPADGKGPTESIIAILLTLAFIATLFFDVSSPFLEGIVALIVGYYFGKKEESYKGRKTTIAIKR